MNASISSTLNSVWFYSTEFIFHTYVSNRNRIELRRWSTKRFFLGTYNDRNSAKFEITSELINKGNLSHTKEPRLFCNFSGIFIYVRTNVISSEISLLTKIAVILPTRNKEENRRYITTIKHLVSSY